jgi:hypothetical protein
MYIHDASLGVSHVASVYVRRGYRSKRNMRSWSPATYRPSAVCCFLPVMFPKYERIHIHAFRFSTRPNVAISRFFLICHQDRLHANALVSMTKTYSYKQSRTCWRSMTASWAWRHSLPSKYSTLGWTCSSCSTSRPISAHVIWIRYASSLCVLRTHVMCACHAGACFVCRCYGSVPCVLDMYPSVCQSSGVCSPFPYSAFMRVSATCTYIRACTRIQWLLVCACKYVRPRGVDFLCKAAFRYVHHRILVCAYSHVYGSPRLTLCRGPRHAHCQQMWREPIQAWTEFADQMQA